MGQPVSGGIPFKVLGTISAIFAIGVVAVSGTLLNQAIRYRDAFYYGGGYGFSADYYSGRFGGGGGGGGGAGYYGGTGGGGYYGGGGGGLGYQDVGYDIYRYQKVIAIAAVALGAGIIQFIASLLLCCTNEDNTKGLSIGYVGGSLLCFLVLVVCFGLAFQYRVIYPYYFYNYYQYYSVYYHYNPEGQAFCAILGIDLIFLLMSAIISGVLARRANNYEDRVEWHVRPTTASTGSPPRHEFRS